MVPKVFKPLKFYCNVGKKIKKMELILTFFSLFHIFISLMSHFNGLEALKAVLIIGTDYRKIDNTLYRYCTGRVTRTCIPTPVIRSRLTQ